MAEEPGKYWVAMAVDNSIPRPEPDEESGFLPMYFNASPLLLPTEEGEDALCVFTTEGKFRVYISAAAHEGRHLWYQPRRFPFGGAKSSGSSLSTTLSQTSW